MDGVIYYPYIRVPESDWFSRTLLYWDSVATIVPDRMIWNPDQLDSYTRDLVQRGLVVQLLPSYADLANLGDRFINYVNELERSDFITRQHNFRHRVTDLIHADKGRDSFFNELIGLGLCARVDRRRSLEHGWDREGTRGRARDPMNRWWRVEQQTAADYMAALALALAQPGHEDPPVRGDRRKSPRIEDVRRLPITDTVHSLIPLLSGTVDATDTELRNRAEGQTRVGFVQMIILGKLFPAPISAVTPEDLERFRRRHGDLLPEFRRAVEERADAIFGLPSQWEQQRALDRLESEFQDTIEQVEAYMSESRFGRLLRSSWCMLLGSIPALNPWVTGAAAAAEIISPGQPRVRSPLAYAAFAAAELLPSQRRPRVIDRGASYLMNIASETQD